MATDPNSDDFDELESSNIPAAAAEFRDLVSIFEGVLAGAFSKFYGEVVPKYDNSAPKNERGILSGAWVLFRSGQPGADDFVDAVTERWADQRLGFIKRLCKPRTSAGAKGVPPEVAELCSLIPGVYYTLVLSFVDAGLLVPEAGFIASLLWLREEPYDKSQSIFRSIGGPDKPSSRVIHNAVAMRQEGLDLIAEAWSNARPRVLRLLITSRPPSE